MQKVLCIEDSRYGFKKGHEYDMDTSNNTILIFLGDIPFQFIKILTNYTTTNDWYHLRFDIFFTDDIHILRKHRIEALLSDNEPVSS
jgi:hypothetical protein